MRLSFLYPILLGLPILLHSINASQVQNIDSSNIEEQFMTDQEYGGYLYQDPRGISCKKCHGEYGKGQHLVSYGHRGKMVEINAPDITQLDQQSLANALRRNNAIMPKYYLTDSEIQALYKYISIRE